MRDDHVFYAYLSKYLWVRSDFHTCFKFPAKSSFGARVTCEQFFNSSCFSSFEFVECFAPELLGMTFGHWSTSKVAYQYACNCSAATYIPPTSLTSVDTYEHTVNNTCMR